MTRKDQEIGMVDWNEATGPARTSGLDKLIEAICRRYGRKRHGFAIVIEEAARQPNTEGMNLNNLKPDTRDLTRGTRLFDWSLDCSSSDLAETSS
jgi:hypothetical protein